MADEQQAEVSEKEKETAAEEEKDQDTSGGAQSPSSRKTPVSSKPNSPKSKATSKPGSAKSGAGSVRSGSAKSQGAKSSARESSRSGSPKSKGKGKASRKKSEDVRSIELPPARTFDDEEGLPEGVIPLFLATKSQEIFHCTGGEDVTEANPYKLLKKEDILKDLFNRAAISDFHPIKQIIQEYPEEELLIGYDPDFKFGQNFFIATTEEAKQKILAPPQAAGEGGEGEAEEVDDTVYTYVPPVPKEWVSLGSEKEIAEESLVENRPRVTMSIKRRRREFGAPVTFSDRNVADAKDGFIECASYEEKSFDLKKMELDKSVQAVPESVEAYMQTDWKYPRNANTQYYAREYTEEEKENIILSVEMKAAMEATVNRFDIALQQNEIMDVFFDDWKALAVGDSTFGSKADNHLKEYQSFTDLQFSKDKTITAIDWHPTIRGIVAVSVGERLSLDERIDNAHRVIMTPSLILIWSFADPIHPQLILEAPDDILCFKFCPTDPNIITGGCINGQVVLWDISQHTERLKQPRGGKRKDNLNTLPGFEDENAMDTPIIRYCAVSSIEHSHKAPVTDILWVPDHFELSRMGVPQENKSGQCVQIMSCATDHPSLDKTTYQGDFIKKKKRLNRSRLNPQRRRVSDDSEEDDSPCNLDDLLTEDELMDISAGVVLVWDTRPPKTGQSQQQHQQQQHEQQQKQEDDNKKKVMGVPTTFKHLDLTWKPHLKVTLTKSEPGGDHAPTKFSIAEKQGDKSILSVPDDDKAEKKATDTMAGGFSFGGPKPGSGKRTLKAMKTHFYVGSEEGEIVYVDWMPQKDQDSGKIQTPKPDYYHSFHDGPVNTLQRSPFFKDIVLCVGGWSFTVWKEGVSSGPILSSSASVKRLTGGHWSPSRPAVFYITKQDGSIDIWDLLDRTHEPSMNQSVSALPITAIYPFQVTNKQHLLAIGDQQGTLHILEIPWSLRQATSNEYQGMANYFDREVKRRTFVVARWDFREKEKMEIEQEKKNKAGIAPNIQLTDEELEVRMKNEYAQFLEEEASFLRSLGLKDDTDEPLPNTD